MLRTVASLVCGVVFALWAGGACAQAPPATAQPGVFSGAHPPVDATVTIDGQTYAVTCTAAKGEAEVPGRRMLADVRVLPMQAGVAQQDTPWFETVRPMGQESCWPEPPEALAKKGILWHTQPQQLQQQSLRERQALPPAPSPRPFTEREGRPAQPGQGPR